MYTYNQSHMHIHITHTYTQKGESSIPEMKAQQQEVAYKDFLPCGDLTDYTTMPLAPGHATSPV